MNTIDCDSPRLTFKELGQKRKEQLNDISWKKWIYFIKWIRKTYYLWHIMHVLKDITKLVVIGSFGKNLINDEIKLSRIKSKGGPGGGRKPGTKNKMTLDKLAKIVTDGFAEQAKFNKQQLKFNTRMEKEVSNLRSDFDRVIKLNNLKH